MISFAMPFASVPCSIWLAHEGEDDGYGNRTIEYADRPDIETRCLYAPGGSMPDTDDDIEDGRPHGTRATVTFYLPKDVIADMRGARISCRPMDDPSLAGRVFDVVGDPISYPRASTPGDYSWAVEGVAHSG